MHSQEGVVGVLYGKLEFLTPLKAERLRETPQRGRSRPVITSQVVSDHDTALSGHLTSTNVTSCQALGVLGAGQLQLAGQWSTDCSVRDSDMSEQDPLLSSSTISDVDHRLESQSSSPQSYHNRARLRTAEVLESAPLHYTVIALASIPALN